jgi:hypothetical protein
LALSSSGQRSFGTFATPDERYSVNSHALTLDNLDAITGPGSPKLGPALGQVTVRAASATPDQHIFIGVAAPSEVSRYLAEVSHSELVEVKFDPSARSTAKRPARPNQPCPAGRAFGPAQLKGRVPSRFRSTYATEAGLSSS